MFRVVLPPIIRSAYNCIYSIWYLSHRYCYLPLSWKCWNGFECAVVSVRHPQHILNILTMHGPINVKSPDNTSKWQMGFNSAFKGKGCIRKGSWARTLSQCLFTGTHIWEEKFMPRHSTFEPRFQNGKSPNTKKNC